ncbi:hypothetical protein PtrARCrB10_07507 [Pyrenophora tritici-repentis]|nr:hypothetical protein PtrARCrB10_07507 [Pyrenophora tritici-repentis]
MHFSTIVAVFAVAAVAAPAPKPKPAEMSTSKSSWLDSYRLQITDNIEARAQWHVPENA